MIARVMKACSSYWGFHSSSETWTAQPKDERVLPEAMKVHPQPTGRSNSAFLSYMHAIEEEIQVRLLLAGMECVEQIQEHVQGWAME